MSYGIRQTENYYWNVQASDVKLGIGATGYVYKCRNKKTGDPFAAKVLSRRAHQRPNDVIYREVDVLKKLKNPNIVKLIAVEAEQSEQSIVLIMELCGKSLYDVLCQPENIYGLPEDDFKDVIFDISNGMEYLRQNNIIHRDVKPGNILQVQDLVSGSFTYKISDFGAAKELEEGGEFTSIYGTEEYLHPDMYAAHMKQRGLGQTFFNSTVDLWSLGVTFYHLATGRLPFNPYHGRSDKYTMCHMISSKEPGAISVEQTQANGPLLSSKELPVDSRISKGLRVLITPVLRGLLETRPDLALSFEDLFKKIREIVFMKIIHVYVSQTSTIHKIYIKGDHKLSHLQDQLAIVTGIKEDEQQLFYEAHNFKPEYDQLIRGYPKFTLEDPLVLISSQFISGSNLDKPRFPSLRYQGEQKKSSPKDDIKFAEMYANYAYSLYFETEKLEAECNAIYKTHNAYKEFNKQTFQLLRLECKNIEEQIENHKKILDNYDKTILALKPKEDSENNSDQANCSKKQQYDGIKGLLRQCNEMVNDLLRGDICEDLWKRETENISSTPSAKQLDGCLNVINEINKMFKKDKDKNILNTEEDVAHNFERKRLRQTYSILHEKVQKDFRTQHSDLHNAIGKWLSEILSKRESLDKVQAELSTEFLKYCNDYTDAINNFQERHENSIKELLGSVDFEDILNIVQENSKTLEYFDKITEFNQD